LIRDERTVKEFSQKGSGELLPQWPSLIDRFLQRRVFKSAARVTVSQVPGLLSLENIELPILEQRPLKKVTLVTITGDRGLCGAYNSAMIKLTEKRARELKALGVPFELVTIGKKGTSWFKRRTDEFPIAESFDCTQNPNAEMAKEIADMLFAKYIAGETDRVEILYSKFESLVATTPTLRTMLPLSPAELKAAEKARQSRRMSNRLDAGAVAKAKANK